MRSTVADILPARVKRSLTKLGADIAMARKKRSLTVVMMAERTGVAKSTYLKLERGNPTVALGAYAMAFFVLGFGESLGEILDAKNDEQGLLLDVERMPQRVRRPKPPVSL
ncbi:MAG: helix-turn-helix transcriptional regulator [Sphingobium sp.]|nr:helix-turn-helix transcriptional regulator [Sphingobium sp.]